MQRSQPSDELLPAIALALTVAGHDAHVGPLHSAKHVQLQPACALPVTLVAWPLQFSGLVHSRWHAGYVALSLPAAQLLHCVCSNRAGHVEQSPDVHWSRHVQLQPVRVLPVTLRARPLQLAADVHFSTQFGYSS